MAARLNKLHTEEIRGHYVYELLMADGAIAYVGKGSGRRLKNQERRFGLSGRIVREFTSATKAYAFEVAHIAKTKPALNKCKGGNGSRNKRVQKPRDPLYRACEALGSRVVAARLALAYAWLVDPSKVDQLRQVANG